MLIQISEKEVEKDNKNLFVFSYVGSCENDYSYCFSKRPVSHACNAKELKILFSILRKKFNDEFLELQKKNLTSYNGYKIGLVITIINPETNRFRYKNYYISPINLKNKG
jgi:hypothetical protein